MRLEACVMIQSKCTCDMPCGFIYTFTIPTEKAKKKKKVWGRSGHRLQIHEVIIKPSPQIQTEYNLQFGY